jgi:hypothetical protein
VDAAIILRFLNVLEQLTEQRGLPNGETLVNKNVSKSENSTFDSGDKKKKSGLNSSDKKTLVETFNLFNQMFFDYQKKMTVDTKEKTKVSQIARRQATPPPIPQESKKKDCGLSLMSMIVGGLALLAASIGGIVASLAGVFGNFGGVVKVVSKLGFVGALKIMGKTLLKKFSLVVLKRLPVIGGIVGLAFAAKAFSDGKIGLGIAELISGLLNFIPGVGPFLSLGADILIAWAQATGKFDKGGALDIPGGWKTIKGWMSTIGKTIMDNALYLPIIGGFKRFGMAYDAFSGGNIGEGFKQLGLGLFTFIGGGAIIKGIEILAGWMDSSKEPEGKFNKDNSWFGKIKKWIVKKLNDLPEFLKVPLRWFGVLDDGGDTSISKMASGALQGAKDGVKNVTEFVGNLWNKVKGPMGDTVNNIGSFANDAWSVTKEYSSKAWSVISEESPKIWNSIKENSSKAWSVISEESPKIWNSIKENSSKAWGYATEEASKIWTSVKDISSKAWDKAKEAGSWFAGAIGEMATKTKDMINTWIPGIVDTISGMANSAMDVLKSIASKIGGWIAGLFSSDDKAKLEQSNKETSEKEQMIKGSGDIMFAIAKENNVQNKWLHYLHTAAIEQIKLLGIIANTANSSLSELKRISGNNSGGGGQTVVVSPQQQAQKTSPVSIDNNRMGFATSAYSLG